MTTSNIAPELKERDDIVDLRQHPDNYNKGVIDVIASSLRYHGMVRPILVSVGTPGLEDGTIVAGNHTFLAAKELGWDKVAVSYRRFPSADDAVRYLIADNETARQAEMDRKKLGALLQPMMEVDVGADGTVSGTGVTEESAHDMLDELEFAAKDPGAITAGHAETEEERAARDRTEDYEAGRAEPMVEAMLVLTRTEHAELMQMIDALKEAWELTSAKAVMLRAVTEAFQTEGLHERESQGAV